MAVAWGWLPRKHAARLDGPPGHLLRKRRREVLDSLMTELVGALTLLFSPGVQRHSRPRHAVLGSFT